MAWRSSGHTNEELVDNLVQNGLITSEEIERAFRGVDRKYFVPKNCEAEAYSDSPIKEGNVHISAPHIYCTILEALGLNSGSSLSFLNIGSGSGYLSCLVSEILGPKSVYFGVELHEDALTHCRQAVSNWHEQFQGSTRLSPLMHFIYGSGLCIQHDIGECLFGFDRIYAGAALNSEQLKTIRQLLCPGGILVAPVEDNLLKVVRTKTTSTLQTNLATENDFEFDAQIVSGVIFAPMQEKQLKTTIPAIQWNIFNHYYFPETFNKATKTILLCRNANFFQKPESYVNVAATIPKEVWLHILSFTNRRWFEPDGPKADKEFHKRRLAQEQRHLTSVRKTLSSAETRNFLLERQNNIYLQTASRFSEQIQHIIEDHSNSFSHTQLSRELLQSTQTLLGESRDVLFSNDADHILSSLEYMDQEGDSSNNDEEMDTGADSESDLMVEDNESIQNRISQDRARQIRVVAVSSIDL